jgi:hypothetical protein
MRAYLGKVAYLVGSGTVLVNHRPIPRPGIRLELEPSQILFRGLDGHARYRFRA